MDPVRTLDTYIKLFQETGYVTLPGIQGALRRSLAGFVHPADQAYLQHMASQAKLRLLEMQLTPSLPFFNPDQGIGGPLRLGHCLPSRSVFGLHPHELAMNVCVHGQPGSGKTNLIYLMSSQLLKIPGTGVCFFDRKQDFRHLKQYFPRLSIVPLSKLPWNPLHQPTAKLPERTLIQLFCEAFCNSNYLLAAKHVLLDLIAQLFKRTNVPPTLHDLFQVLSHPPR